MKPNTKRIVTNILFAFGVSFITFLVYLLTLTPSLSYLSPDGSELATIPYILGLAHSPGYPLYTWLGFFFSHGLPIGDVAFRMNLMSASMGALGVGFFYLILVLVLPNGEQETKSRWWIKRFAAVSGALLFAFSPDFWEQAVITEVYAPNIFFVAITLLLLLLWQRKTQPWVYFLFALAFGLSLGTHISNLGFAPAFLLFTLLVHFYKARQPRSIKTLFPPLLQTAFAGLLGFGLGAAQFIWLPLRASTLNDRMMLKIAPTSLRNIYAYTLGAFPNFKFAFPLTALPDRLDLYLLLLLKQYHLIGVLLGLLGLFVLLFHKPRTYFLLVGMYLVHVWFFIQYNAFDLEVFFIPAHLLWASFLTFGIWYLLNKLSGAGKKRAVRILLSMLQAGFILLIVLLVLGQVKNHWVENNFSQDTAINDFYTNLWEILPQGSTLVTPGGVFGYDAFYWQLVYHVRPDVTLPLLPSPQPSSHGIPREHVYATASALQKNRGPGAIPPELLSKELWQIPILIGEEPVNVIGRRTPLVLYQLSKTPPEIAVSNPHPGIPVNQSFGAYTLLGADIAQTSVESGSTVQITLTWQISQQAIRQAQLPRTRIAITVDNQSIEQHEIGFGILQRYVKEVGLPENRTFMDKYTLVIPSWLSTGEHSLGISLASLDGQLDTIVPLQTIDIVNNQTKFERWLQIVQEEK